MKILNMQKIDDTIKKAIQSRAQPIEDVDFTKKLFDKYMADKKLVEYKPFINFLPFIIGLSWFVLCLGLLILIKQNIYWIKELGVTVQHGIILTFISMIYLTYIFLEELSMPSLRLYTK